MCAHRVVWEPPKGVNRQHNAHTLGGIEPTLGWTLGRGLSVLRTCPFGSRSSPAEVLCSLSLLRASLGSAASLVL